MTGRFAVDLGGSKIRAGAVGDRGELTTVIEEPVLRPNSSAPLVEQIVRMIRGVTGGRPGAGVVTTPGSVDWRTGVIGHAANLPLEGVPLADELSALTGGAVRVVVDTAAGAVAEFGGGGAADRARSGGYLTVSSGIGATLVVEGRVYPGSRHRAGELGHVPVTLDPAAPLCGCGRRGCLEAYASGLGITDLLRARGIEVSTGREVLDAAVSGQPAAIEVVDAAADLLAIAVSGLLQLLDPEALVLGGGMVLGGGLFEPIKQRVVQRGDLPADQVDRSLRMAAYGENSPLVGAAALAAGSPQARAMMGWT